MMIENAHAGMTSRGGAAALAGFVREPPFKGADGQRWPAGSGRLLSRSPELAEAGGRAGGKFT
jgi:hypothetical protein